MSRLAHEPSCLEFVTSHTLTHTHTQNTHTHTHLRRPACGGDRITRAHTDTQTHRHTRKHAYTHMHKLTWGEAPSTRRRVKRKLNPASNPFFFPEKEISQKLDQHSIHKGVRFINGVRAKKQLNPHSSFFWYPFFDILFLIYLPL